jgi:NCAIR mutase (PurE)-related protein
MMDRNRLLDLLNEIANQDLTPEDALKQLQLLPFKDLGFAKVDLHRAIRQGLPEVIFAPGKTINQIIEIAKSLREQNQIVVATRVRSDQAEHILNALAGAIYEERAQMIIWGQREVDHSSSEVIAVVSAGTSDLPVAEEAACFLEVCGVSVRRIYDVGVAGLHRLLANLELLNDVSATIVVAGMDGALPSVIGGLIACPIIAVPTSVGYGSSFEGLSALLTMLNSCASGITVVNIDNGFGAAFAAMRMLSSRKTNLANISGSFSRNL